MNKYRNINPQAALPVPQEPTKVRGLLDRGIVLFRSAQDIDLSESPDLDCVRVVEKGLRQDLGLTVLSTAAAFGIISLGEHKYVVSGSETFQRTFRLFQKASSLVRIESWNGLTWDTEVDTDDWTVEDVLLSYRTYFATAFWADGKRVLKWIQTTSFVSQSDDFEADNGNNPLTAVNDTVDAAVVPAASVDDEYDVHYGVVITGPGGGGSSITVAILDDGAVEVAEVVHSIPASDVTGRVFTLGHEIASVIASIASGENLTLKLKAISATGVERTNVLIDQGSGTPQWTVVKDPAREADSDDYTFHFSVADGSTGGSTLVEFYYDTGAGWVLWDNSEAFPAGEYVRTFRQAGLGSGDDFGMKIPDADQEDFQLFDSPRVSWNDSFKEGVSVHGFNLATDADVSQGVTYQTEGTPANDFREVDQDPDVTPNVDGATATSGGTKTITDTGAGWDVDEWEDDWVEIMSGLGSGQFRKIVSNTSDTLTVGEDWTTEPDATSVFDIYTPVLLPARYLGVFGDRLIALQVDEDPQKIAWPISGDPTDWVGEGSGSSILASNSKVDPVDELMAFEPLSNSIAVLFRKRSIMRVALTGVVDNALGFYRWIESLGTESPFSPTPVPGGLMFLGHDKQVYFLTEQGPTPVSQFIQEELEASIGDLSLVEGTYDTTNQKFMLAVPGLSGSNTAVTWLLDYGRMIAEKVIVWQRRTETMNRLAIAGDQVIFAGSDDIVRQFDVDNPCDGAYWVSPMLNRGNKEAEFSLAQVILRYQAAAATTLVIEASNDGGVTWTAGNKVTVTLAATTSNIRRAVQGFSLGGYDLRFRITFPSDEFVTINSWRADLVERGDLGAE